MKLFMFIPLLLIVFISPLYAQKRDTITTGSGLKYICFKPGKGDKLINGQKVKVIYTGKFLNGKQFESNKGDKPFKFTLGAGEVIPGWDEGFKLMSPGEKGVLIIPASLAYGPAGVKHWEDEKRYHIPPDTDLIFEVEIIDAR